MTMRVFEDAWHSEELPRGAVATIGNFDGVHVGQAALLRRIQERAAEFQTGTLVITFEPHPLKVLQPERAPLRLTTLAQKLTLLEETGIDAVAILSFDFQLAEVSAGSFIDDFLVARLAVAEVHVGSRFSFGRGREGSLEMLIDRGTRSGFEARGIAEVLHASEPVSSTRIRQAVADGDVDEAALMLGRPFSVSGEVAGGESRGSLLGWPTANLEVENELFPHNGVYVTEALLEGEADARPAVTNVGVRPTFDGVERRIETHLLDFEGDLYGRRLELNFLRYLRGERRFASSEELIAQIEEDAQQAREYFAANSC
jgi:riboflavin kinase/FMN adenylyltransferase